MVIPPVSEKVNKVEIGDHYKWQTSIIEPVADLSNKRLAMARCIVSPKSNVVMCKLLNPALESVYLRRWAKIGTIEPIDLNVGQTAVCSLESKTDVNKRDAKTERPLLQSSEEVINELGIKIDKGSLTEGDYFELVNFLAKNRDIFARSLADLSGTDLMLHKIDTADLPPF